MSGTVKWYLHWITRKILPENAPVRLTRAQLEELDYRRLYRAYSPKERKSAADPRVMFKVMAYGYQCRIYSSRGWEEACWYRVDFMWLLEEENVPDHATFARFRKRCAAEIEDLFYQYTRLLEKQLTKVKEKVQTALSLDTLAALEEHLAQTAEGITLYQHENDCEHHRKRGVHKAKTKSHIRFPSFSVDFPRVLFAVCLPFLLSIFLFAAGARLV